MFPGLFPAFGSAEALPPQTGLLNWYKTPIVGLVDNDTFAPRSGGAGGTPTWPDQTTNAEKLFNLESGTSPKYRTTSVTINGLPVVDFDAAATQALSSQTHSGAPASGPYYNLTEASIYIVGRLDNDVPAAQAKAGLWTLNPVDPGNFLVEFPGILAANQILESTFSTTRRTTVDPTPSLASPFYYGVLSKANSFKTRLNGTEIFSTGTNTFQPPLTSNFSESYRFGQSADGTFTFYYDGVIAEILIYDHFLAAGEITDLETYLANRFAI